MRFVPSSLTPKSHRLLTALVDSRHKKVYKVKNCVTDIDLEKEEQKERAESQTIRANELLNRKKEKVNRKYTQTVRRERQLSPGFLEDAVEDDEPDYYESRHPAPRRRFDDDMEMGARAEKWIINAKKGHKDIPRKSSLPAAKSSRRPVEFSDSEREESEYETDGEEEDRSPARRIAGDPELDEEEEEEHYEEEAAAAADEASEEEEPNYKAKQSQRNFKCKEIESDEESPKRKPEAHRRMAVVYDSDEE